MTKEIAEKIENSQFKEVYFEFMKTDKTGTNYINAVLLIDEINSIMRKSRTDNRKNKEYLDISIINEIYADVINEIHKIDCVSFLNDTIVILSASVARDLIKKGFVVQDIKPNKHDSKKTVFVFQKTNCLMTYLKANFFKSKSYKEKEHTLVKC